MAMKYVGIDLGTTNSAICSFDGENVRLYKSPEQNDVTPSALFFDKRGNKYIGTRAYNNAAKDPSRAATIFKRFMGTDTLIKIAGLAQPLTPEDCSSEILKALFSYLPEELRDAEVGTVITVPAAFNQMQKDATIAAAEIAGIGKVALLQEPVAAVMSVMRVRKKDGVFLIYDLGGGTLDVAIAESTGGRVSLLAHGGVAMCGGRDFDLLIFNNIVKPWLRSKFNLPSDFAIDPRFNVLNKMGVLASERAKIELSQKSDTAITMAETEINVKDLDGEDIYFDIEFSAEKLNGLMEDKIKESVAATREALEKVQLSPQDVDSIVFVGGPTQYKPLRDKVAFEMGIKASTEVNPMTAVSEGAALFAESIDWSAENRTRKESRGSVSTGSLSDLSFNFIARTTNPKAKIVAKLGDAEISGAEFQIDNLDTGWSSGRIPLKNGAAFDLPLGKMGDNNFRVFVFDGAGRPQKIANDRILIARTTASVDAIPASKSVGIESLTKIGGSTELVYLIKEGDSLPKKGREIFAATESLRAGSPKALVFKIWEGEIPDPVSDNRLIATFEVRGSDFSDGVIAAGDRLLCDYEILDSGNIFLKVSVPSIGSDFQSGRNFYSRQREEISSATSERDISEKAQAVMDRIDEISLVIDDPRLTDAKKKLSLAQTSLADSANPEESKRAMDDIQEAKKLLSQAKNDNLSIIRMAEIDQLVENFDSWARKDAKPTEIQAFENSVKMAKRDIEKNNGDFESSLRQMGAKISIILWRQPDFLISRFQWLSSHPQLFNDSVEYARLVKIGNDAMRTDNMDGLRKTCWELMDIQIKKVSDDDISAVVNIVRGS